MQSNADVCCKVVGKFLQVVLQVNILQSNSEV